MTKCAYPQGSASSYDAIVIQVINRKKRKDVMMPEMSMTDFSVVPRLSGNEILGKIATNTHKCHNFDFNDYETL